MMQVIWQLGWRVKGCSMTRIPSLSISDHQTSRWPPWRDVLPLCISAVGVALCEWSAKQTIPLSVLARNKGLGLEISDEAGSGGKRGPREARSELAKEPREAQLAKRDAERQSRTEQRGPVKDELAFLVAFVGVSRKIYARDSLQNARKVVQKSVTKLPFLHLELA